jgi:type I site-specific restriction endonuclease
MGGEKGEAAATVAAAPAQEKPKLAEADVGKVTPARAVEAGKRLQGAIEAINKETEELDFFKKTWVKNDFNRRNGMSLKDWQKTGADLTADFGELAKAAEAGDTAKANALKAKFPVLLPRVEKLERYIQSSIENAKQYFKDPKQQETALEALAQRQEAVRDVIKALKELS